MIAFRTGENEMRTRVRDVSAENRASVHAGGQIDCKNGVEGIREYHH